MNKKSENTMIITIDGGSGTGKTTISTLLASKLNFQCLSSGLLYRKIAFIKLDKKIDILDKDKLTSLQKEIFPFENENNISKIIKYISQMYDSKFFTEEISLIASQVAKNSFVREFVNEILIEISKIGNIIFEGRDMGTVVFPNADLKIFLKINSQVAAKRRKEQFTSNKDYNEILEGIVKRDEEDQNRELAPLKIPKDAIIFDTTNFTVEESVNRLYYIIEKNLEK